MIKWWDYECSEKQLAEFAELMGYKHYNHFSGLITKLLLKYAAENCVEVAERSPRDICIEIKSLPINDEQDEFVHDVTDSIFGYCNTVDWKTYIRKSLFEDRTETGVSNWMIAKVSKMSKILNPHSSTVDLPAIIECIATLYNPDGNVYNNLCQELLLAIVAGTKDVAVVRDGKHITDITVTNVFPLFVTCNEQTDELLVTDEIKSHVHKVLEEYRRKFTNEKLTMTDLMYLYINEKSQHVCKCGGKCGK